MDYYAGIDVSLESSSVCVVDGAGKIVREAKVASEPEALIGWFGVGLDAGADRPGSGPVVAMALCGAARGGSCGGTSGNAARARRLQGDVGEDRPQRRAQHRPVDADGLVPAGALQVDRGARDTCGSEGAQAVAIEAAGCREQPARDTARLRAEGRQDHRARLRGTDQRTGRRPPRARGRCQGVAGRTCRAAARVQWSGQAGSKMARSHRAGEAFDDDARGRTDRGADLCLGDRRSEAVQIIEGGWCALRA